MMTDMRTTKAQLAHRARIHGPAIAAAGLEPKKLGRPALPPELKRGARLSMRTYQEVADKAARVGTAAVEAAILRIKEPAP
jgi:hypothetical protein